MKKKKRTYGPLKRDSYLSFLGVTTATRPAKRTEGLVFSGVVHETRYLSVLPFIISPGKRRFSGVLLPLDLSGPLTLWLKSV